MPSPAPATPNRKRDLELLAPQFAADALLAASALAVADADDSLDAASRSARASLSDAIDRAARQ